MKIKNGGIGFFVPRVDDLRIINRAISTPAAATRSVAIHCAPMQSIGTSKGAGLGFRFPGLKPWAIFAVTRWGGWVTPSLAGG
ncbi:MAG: hypothetical protein CV087_23785 [Candidatus Brocadia sp. WS118]|nr:MAG: hypothetical protein CV087_23785 [Candidatus Brocadia sp. WS118]